MKDALPLIQQDEAQANASGHDIETRVSIQVTNRQGPILRFWRPKRTAATEETPTIIEVNPPASAVCHGNDIGR